MAGEIISELAPIVRRPLAAEANPSKTAAHDAPLEPQPDAGAKFHATFIRAALLICYDWRSIGFSA
jgi:hypothetical protein